MQSDVYTIAAMIENTAAVEGSSEGDDTDPDTTTYTGELTVPQTPKRLILGRQSEEYREQVKRNTPPGHKTPRQIATTKAAHAMRNNRKAAKDGDPV